MLPYHFDQLFFKITGEYENGIRMVFTCHSSSHILTYEAGNFSLENKYTLQEYKQYPLQQSHIIQHILSSTAFFIQLQTGILKIASFFDTAAGQTVEDFQFCTKDQNPEAYNHCLLDILSAQPVDITDERN